MKSLKSGWKKVFGQRRRQMFGLLAFMIGFAAIGGIYLLSKTMAAGDRFYLTPAQTEVQPGSNFTVTLRMETSSNAIIVDASIIYDHEKLQLVSVDGSASPLTMQLLGEEINNTVHVSRAIVGSSVTGDVEIAKLTFKALDSASGNSTIAVSGQAQDETEANIVLTFDNATVNILGSGEEDPVRSATFTIEPTVAAPVVGTSLGLGVYVDSNVNYQGGQLTVNLPAGLSYTGTLNTTGTAFNPATTVTGTGAQTVNLVFITQSNTLTGKQLIATIPVNATTVGAKSITMTGGRLADLNDADITPVTADAFSLTVNAASLPAPLVTRAGKTQISATEDITDLMQAFTITNFDAAATYTVTLGGQNLTVSGSGFSIPASLRNGNHSLQVSATKSGASGNNSYTIRLRSPNINRTDCVELLDLLLVNRGYGAASNELDLNLDGTVGLVDLLTVTGNWGGACVQ